MDNLKHRGRLTREIVTGLSYVIQIDPTKAVQEFAVIFVGKDATPIVRMRLLAALQSVTFDISAHEQHDWGHAFRAIVVPALRSDGIPSLVP